MQNIRLRSAICGVPLLPSDRYQLPVHSDSLAGMAAPARSATVVPPSAWWLILCLVGLDYFSTLAYFPSLAVEAAGPLAPFAALLVVFVTLFMAVPVYAFVVGRSPHGTGATGLLEQTIHGLGATSC